MARFARIGKPRHRPVAISLPDELVGRLDAAVQDHGARGRSAIVQEAIRRYLLEEEAVREPSGERKALLVVCYETHDSPRVNAVGQKYQGLVQSMMHTHVGHEECIETYLVAGTGQGIRNFVEALKTLRGLHFVRRIDLPAHDAQAAEKPAAGYTSTGAPS